MQSECIIRKYYIFYKINDLTTQLKYLKHTNLDSKTIKLKQITQNNKIYKYSNLNSYLYWISIKI